MVINKEVASKINANRIRVVPFRRVTEGQVFLPIEKTGRPFLKKDSTGRVNQERQWKIGDELYVRNRAGFARSLHRDRDGIFLGSQLCIVKGV